MQVARLVERLVEEYGYSREELAQSLEVAPSTVARWMAAETRPRPYAEGKLRRLYDAAEKGAFQPSLFAQDPSRLATIALVDDFLIELRESLHRHSRIASRNEALDEVARLLFAHFARLSHGRMGLGAEVLRSEHAGQSTPVALAKFVETAIREYLPESLSHEVSTSDFALQIRPTEVALADEIVALFDRLNSSTPEHAGHFAADVMNEVFGKFLASSFADERQLGQYLTPPEVVSYMTKLALADMTSEEMDCLLSPDRCTEFGLVLDPSCGVGSFLAEFVREVQGAVTAAGSGGDGERWIRAMSPSVVGIDKSERMIRLALTNMASFGMSTVNLHLANSLVRDGADAAVTRDLEGRVRLILTNPPFGAEFPADSLGHYRLANEWTSRAPRKVDSELLFVERYLDWLMPGGQLLAVVPDSVLTNRGLFADLRRALAPSVQLRGVTSLPPETFSAAGTSTKTSVLHFRKKSDTMRGVGPALFAVCADVGYEVVTRGSHRVKKHTGNGELPELLASFASGEEDGYRGRWISNATSVDRWDAGFHTSLPVEMEERLAEVHENELRLKSVATLSSERTDPRRWPGPTFRYIEISDVEGDSMKVGFKEVACADAPSRARRLVREGDVLISTVRPERRTAGVVGRDCDGAVCSTGFAVLRPEGIDPLLLAMLLRTDYVTLQLMRNNVGIAYPAIEESCLPNVLLPVDAGTAATLRMQCERVREQTEKLDDARRELLERVNVTAATV